MLHVSSAKILKYLRKNQRADGWGYLMAFSGTSLAEMRTPQIDSPTG